MNIFASVPPSRFHNLNAGCFVKHIFCVTAFFALISFAHAQPISYKRYAVYFKDKDNNPYSIYNPTAYLSQRALDRRNRQQIAIDGKDIPVSPQYVEGVAAAGATVHYASKWLNAVVIRVEFSDHLQIIESLPYVDHVEMIAKYKVPAADKPLPKKPLQLNYPHQTYFPEPNYGMALRQIDILNGVGLHRKGFTGNGVLVAVFDAGFHNADVHPGLQAIYNSGRLLATRDFVNSIATVYNGANHGTQCFSVIGCYDPSRMIGTAPGASFVLCHTEDGDSEFPVEEFNWVAAAEYADSIGADVISSSLGYTTFEDTIFNHTYSQLDGNTLPAAIAADIAVSKGLVVINSAGNSGEKPWHYISTPADADSILAVGAVQDSAELVVGFSSRGYSPDGRVKPDVMALGLKVTLANPGNLDYHVASGTSFAAPAISGMAACLLQAHPNANANDVAEAIRKSCDRYTNPNPDYGYGIPDFQLADLLLSNINLKDFTTNPEPMIYPNPFHGDITVVRYSDSVENGIVEIVDMMGRMQQVNTYTIQPGYNQLVTNFSLYPAGMYIIRLTTQTQSYELKALHQ